MNLLRIDEETTCNIGTLKAEYATNIVPEKAEFVAEVRSRNLDKLMRRLPIFRMLTGCLRRDGRKA